MQLSYHEIKPLLQIRALDVVRLNIENNQCPHQSMPETIKNTPPHDQPSLRPTLSGTIPPPLVPVVKLVLAGLVVVAAMLAIAIYRRNSVPPTPAPQTPAAIVPEENKLVANLDESLQHQQFTVALPSELSRKTIGNQILFFASDEAAAAYDTCTTATAEQEVLQCHIAMSLSIQTFAPDHDFSLEKNPSSDTQNLLNTSYTDARNRSWLIAPANARAEGLALIAETKTSDALHQVFIEVNAAPYAEVYAAELTPEALLNTAKDLLSTVEFTNQ